LKVLWLEVSIEHLPSNILPLSNGPHWKNSSCTTIQCTPKSSQENKAIKGLNTKKVKTQKK